MEPGLDLRGKFRVSSNTRRTLKQIMNNTNLYRELANAIVRLHCFIALNAARNFLLKEEQTVSDIHAELISSAGTIDPAVLAGFIEMEIKNRIERGMLTQEILPAILENLQAKYGITFTNGFMEHLRLL